MIDINNITVKLEEKVILSELNLNVQKGKLIVLIGDNGSGKSTLLKVIAGRIKVDSGSISVLEPLTYHQQDFPLLENMTINENIIIYSKALEFEISKDEVDRLLVKLALYKHRSTCIEKLSGGQRQRLGLIITLLRNQEIYIIDEADSAMDPKGRTLFYEALCELRDEGKTILFISHHVKETLKFIDGCYLISHGKASYIDPSDIEDWMYKYTSHEFMLELEKVVGVN